MKFLRLLPVLTALVLAGCSVQVRQDLPSPMPVFILDVQSSYDPDAKQVVYTYTVRQSGQNPMTCIQLVSPKLYPVGSTVTLEIHPAP